MSESFQPGDVSAQRRVDEACLRFEAAWQAHRADPDRAPRPRPEEFLAAAPEADRPLLARELLTLDLAYRRRAGEAPTEPEYLARFPALEAAVRAAFAPGERTTPPTPAGDADLPPGAAVRYFGDYEIEGEIGRGGMGIIYRARQKSLNRTVALKMIRAAVQPTAEQVQRFRLEAEAVAGLEHEGIVSLYEVGEHHGQHYFSMRLIDGGSLASRVSHYVNHPCDAARLLIQVARAVHHAHQRGVLHRDLKPSNILLDREGRPYVTDFGLARRLGGAGATLSGGAIIGTPGYMAPEQARAEKGVTTAADVYGLGAVLYELLTGRPPFAGDDALDVLTRVVSEEPSRPRTLNLAVDRDLETVCLACLEKDPRKRYGSAQEVAEELERWLRAEPIQRRPVGRVERAWRWCRRNPVVAGLTGALGAALVGGIVISSLFAVRAERKAQEAESALVQVEEHLAAGILRPVVNVEPFSADREKVLAELASLPPSRDRVRLHFVELALTPTETVANLEEHLRESLQAAVGLDRGIAELVRSLLLAKMCDEQAGKVVRQVAALALAELELIDDANAVEAAELLAERLKRSSSVPLKKRIAKAMASCSSPSAKQRLEQLLAQAAVSVVSDVQPDELWETSGGEVDALVALCAQLPADVVYPRFRDLYELALKETDSTLLKLLLGAARDRTIYLSEDQHQQLVASTRARFPDKQDEFKLHARNVVAVTTLLKPEQRHVLLAETAQRISVQFPAKLQNAYSMIDALDLLYSHLPPDQARPLIRALATRLATECLQSDKPMWYVSYLASLASHLPSGEARPMLAPVVTRLASEVRRLEPDYYYINQVEDYTRLCTRLPAETPRDALTQIAAICAEAVIKKSGDKGAWVSVMASAWSQLPRHEIEPLARNAASTYAAALRKVSGNDGRHLHKDRGEDAEALAAVSLLLPQVEAKPLLRLAIPHLAQDVYSKFTVGEGLFSHSRESTLTAACERLPPEEVLSLLMPIFFDAILTRDDECRKWERDKAGRILVQLVARTHARLPSSPSSSTLTRADLLPPWRPVMNYAEEQFFGSGRLDLHATVELLKSPFTVGDHRAFLLRHAGRLTGQTFPTRWDLVAWLQEHRPDIDLRSPFRK